MKKIITAALLFTAAFSAPTFSAETPFYAGAQVGDGLSILGGYQIDKMFSAEIDYTSFGSHSSYTACGLNNCGNNANAYSLGFYGAAILPLNINGVPHLSAFGKAGLVHTEVRVWGGTYTDNSVGLGAGAQYDFTPQISARLGLDINTYYSNNLYIGALVKF